MDQLYVVAVLVALAVSLAVIRQIDATARWGERLRSRLLMGVPWGTLIAVAVVLTVYLVVQSGWENTRNPVIIPFQSWSYTYPLGWLTAGFAHSGYGHLLSNVTAMLVLGSLAEYAVAHYPQRRGAVSFGTRWDHPYIRAFVIVPVALIATGLFTSLFALGPVIGFSGVVFAVAGVALVRYPLATVLALFGIRALRRVYEAVQTPTFTRGFVETGPSPPWWAEVAVQGHAIGLLAGVIVGIYLFRRRDAIPPAWRIWTGVFLFGIAQNLWAVYWFEGTDRWILLQGIGVVLVIALAVAVTAAAASADRPLLRGVSSRQTAVAVLVVSLALLMGPAVAVNLITTDPGDAADRPGVEVDDFRVIYAEGISNQMVAVGGIDIGGLGEVRTSGVIVYSEERDIWVRAVSAASLADRGIATVELGGIASRTTVVADRASWSVLGNQSVYQVWLAAEDDEAMAFESGPSTADVTIADHNITIASDDGVFLVSVEAEGEVVATEPIPDEGDSVVAGALTLEHRDGTLYAIADGTRVAVASNGR